MSRKDPKPKQSSKDNAPTPKEARRAREITVHISNEVDKDKIKILSAKDECGPFYLHSVLLLRPVAPGDTLLVLRLSVARSHDLQHTEGDRMSGSTCADILDQSKRYHDGKHQHCQSVKGY